MRGQSGICLFCRNGFIARSSINAAKRLASSRKREPYVLPRLVIDLDAADSKFVKRYEDMAEEEVAEHKNPESPLTRRVAGSARRKFTRDYQWFNPHFIAPPDLLSYALLGDAPAHHSIKQLSTIGKAFREAGIRLEDSPHTKIQYLTTRFSADAAERLIQAGFSKEREDFMREKIQNRKNFRSLQRIISILSTSHDGCKFLAANGKYVVEGIRQCRKQQGSEEQHKSPKKVSSSMVLRLLNNLHRSMESKGVEIGPDLCNAGIYYASKHAILPAIKMYLEISLRNSYPTNNHTSRGVRHLQKLCEELHNESLINRPFNKVRRKEILTLITGWEGGIVPHQGEDRRLSFASLLHDDRDIPNLKRLANTQCLSPSYIGGLGEMGLSDALWAEWNAHEPRHLQSGRDIEDNICRARLFALAFLIGRDKQHAIVVLQSATSSTDSTTNPSSDGHPLENRQRKLILSAISEHYTYQSLQPTEKLWSKIKKRFCHLPQDPEQTLEVLERFIVPEYRNAFAGNSQAIIGLKRDLDWGEMDGQEGLLVTSSWDTAPLYFKPVQKTDEFSV